MNSYLLSRDCHLVKGWFRSVLQDNTRNDYDFISESLFELLEKNNLIGENEFNVEDKNWLLKNEYIFYIGEIPEEAFPEINLSWKSPSIITNVIIENSIIHHVNRTFELLSNMNCYHGDVLIKNKEFCLPDIKTQNFKFIKFFIPYNEKKLSGRSNELVILYDSPLNEIRGNIIKTTKSLKKQNGASFEYFSINLKLFIESQKHHTYFNRKMYIGENGEIKNAPECDDEFGFIQDIKSESELNDIISSTEFQKYWYVYKDICDVCKDCEFRHMCIDNRVPHKRKKNEWYHKQECNYNPYIAKWEGEEGYNTLLECGVKSNENEFSIDRERIVEINKELWGIS
tara:strand:- start:562 stop:1587 length:1026 start_codon:yes stop_codon:yes gene_type:complete